MQRKLLIVSTLLIGLSGVACADHSGYYYARSAPPPPRYEVVGVAPAPGYVWVNGYWAPRGRGYEWVRGSWVRPPHRHAVWVPGRWVEGRHGRRWKEGHWR
jgi:WXXGXW repeat (2 copies)